jgi:DNA-binding CsgD family transcriptional regulator
LGVFWGEVLVQQTVDDFRVVSQAFHPIAPSESGSEHEVISDEAINSARSIITDALDAYRRQTSGMMTPVDPLTMTRVLRAAVSQDVGSPAELRVTGDPTAGLTESGAADFVEFMRRDILSAGHGLRLLRRQTGPADRAERRLLGTLADEGAQVRVLGGDLPALLTLGTELAILRTAGSAGREETLLVRGGGVVGVLRRMQRALWDQAGDLPRTGGRQVAPLVLDSAQSQVLDKLCAGMKDETAARQMNVSVRTYRRHVATILRSLDVSSRFEAGLKVAELGLVSGARSTGAYDGA